MAQLERNVRSCNDDDETAAAAVVAAASRPEIGILGFDPTGPSGLEPLRRGVTSTLPTSRVVYGINRQQQRVIATSFVGRRSFEVVGEPWLDPTHSFFLAHVEVTTTAMTTMDGDDDDDVTFEILPDECVAETERLFYELPELVTEWMAAVFDADLATPAALQEQIKRIQTGAYSGGMDEHHHHRRPHRHSPPLRSSSSSPGRSMLENTIGYVTAIIPQTQRDRALWVTAALLNPIQPCYRNRRDGQRVCPDIRPAMLACRNNYDRLVLVTTALRSSLEYCRRYKYDNHRKRQ